MSPTNRVYRTSSASNLSRLSTTSLNRRSLTSTDRQPIESSPPRGPDDRKLQFSPQDDIYVYPDDGSDWTVRLTTDSTARMMKWSEAEWPLSGRKESKHMPTKRISLKRLKQIFSKPWKALRAHKKTSSGERIPFANLGSGTRLADGQMIRSSRPELWLGISQEPGPEPQDGQHAVNVAPPALRRAHILRPCGHMVRTTHPTPCLANCACYPFHIDFAQADGRTNHPCPVCIEEYLERKWRGVEEDFLASLQVQLEGSCVSAPNDMTSLYRRDHARRPTRGNTSAASVQVAAYESQLRNLRYIWTAQRDAERNALMRAGTLPIGGTSLYTIGETPTVAGRGQPHAVQTSRREKRRSGYRGVDRSVDLIQLGASPSWGYCV